MGRLVINNSMSVNGATTFGFGVVRLAYRPA